MPIHHGPRVRYSRVEIEYAPGDYVWVPSLEWMIDARVIQIPVQPSLWPEMDEGCWPWGGMSRANKAGWRYGRVNGYDELGNAKRRFLTAHRVIWSLVKGVPVGPGMDLDHQCPGLEIPNTLCVNPSHVVEKDRIQHCRESVWKREARKERERMEMFG